jgi:two-component system repressor protein LuxO
MTKSILLVEDDPPIARVYLEYLSKSGYDLHHVVTGTEALSMMASADIDLAIVDLRLPDMDGLQILEEITHKKYPAEVIVITGQGTMANAIQAMKLGASDFLAKPFNKDRLLTTVENTLQRQNLDRIVKTYQKEIDRHEYHGFVGSSLVMQGVYRIIDSAASSKASVFITGESGTGKEVCAEAVHRASERADKPFVAINCSAIPKDLIESEIFGHVKGAFTGAISNRAGAAQMADGGTLFLDEICEMDINLQSKLLRFLQTGQIQSVGSSKLTNVDVRIICATNRDPLLEVEQGRFREDLYYRLHVLPVQMPPLRERGGDIMELAEQFLKVYSEEEGKAFSGFSPEVEKIIQRFTWPGNIRQLQNVIRNVVVLSNGSIVEEKMLPLPFDATLPSGQQTPAAVAGTDGGHAPSWSNAQPEISAPGGDGPASILPMEEVERLAISRALEICGNNVPEAAHYLKISAATIYRKRSAWKTESRP